MSDLVIPAEPASDIDHLIEFFNGRFGAAKEKILAALIEARELRDKAVIVQLGFDALILRGEIDSWSSFAAQLLAQEHGNQLAIAHRERSDEAKDRGSKRPDATVVKAQAEQFIAPLKRAQGELEKTRDWLDKILSWCQTQQKLIASDEFGELWSSGHEAPESAAESAAGQTSPPPLTESLRRMESVSVRQRQG